MNKRLCLIDTSILLNLLNIPNKNQDSEAVFADFQAKIEAGETFFLSLATIIETGNHIGHLPDGNSRYGCACALLQQVKAALDGKSPFVPLDMCSREELRQWMDDFPHEHAAEGRGVGDMMLVKECQRLRMRHPRAEVYVWSLDSDLTSYGRCC